MARRRNRPALDSPGRLFDTADLALSSEELRELLSPFRDELAKRLEETEPSTARATDLLEWGRKYLPDHFSRPESPLHRWLADQLQRMRHTRGTKLNLVGPRGSAKSTIGALSYPLRAALEGWEPYIWIVSDTKHQARGHLENIKQELVDNVLLARDYPTSMGKGPVWRSGAIVLPSGAAIEAFGTGQRIRGRRRRAHRPTMIICDDLQNDQHMESARQRDLSRRWFQGTLMKAGTPDTNVLHLATALHREALAIQLQTTAGWISKTFASIERWPEDMALWAEWEKTYTNVDDEKCTQRALEFYDEHLARMNRGARVLWPEVEDLYTLMRMRAEGGHAAFSREKQCSPVNDDTCEWPDSYFDGNIWFTQWPEELRIKTMALDPSKGQDAQLGDYSAFVMLGVDKRGLLYVEADLARRPTSQMVADGVQLYCRFRPDAFGVEVNQYQELLCDEFAAEFTRQGVLAPRPWTLDNRVNKRVRIRRLGPYLAGQRLRFCGSSASTRLLIEQLRDFPMGRHDDGPDATEMAIRLAAELLCDGPADDGLGQRFVIGG